MEFYGPNFGNFITMVLVFIVPRVFIFIIQGISNVKNNQVDLNVELEKKLWSVDSAKSELHESWLNLWRFNSTICFNWKSNFEQSEKNSPTRLLIYWILNQYSVPLFNKPLHMDLKLLLLSQDRFLISSYGTFHKLDWSFKLPNCLFTRPNQPRGSPKKSDKI